MSLYLDVRQQLTSMANTLNAQSFTISDYVFSKPMSIEETNLVEGSSTSNTLIRLTATDTSKALAGSTRIIKYGRLNLGDLPNLYGSELVVRANDCETVYQLIPFINRFKNASFTEFDLEDAMIDYKPEYYDEKYGSYGKVILKAKPDSEGWIGEVEVKVIEGPLDVTKVIANTNLDGLHYTHNIPDMGYAEQITYGIDYTEKFENVTAIMEKEEVMVEREEGEPGYKLPAIVTLPPLPNEEEGETPLTEEELAARATIEENNVYVQNIVDLLTWGTGYAWESSTDKKNYNIHNAEIVYAGVNDPNFGLNEEFDYLIMIKLDETLNTQFAGTLLFHFNAPVDPESV